MKNKKEQFLEAVRILAPGNELFLKLAMRVNEAELPQHPGGVALEFVAALEKLSGCGVAEASYCGRAKGRCVSEDTRAERKARWGRSRARMPRRGCRSRALAAGETPGVPGAAGGLAMVA
jgi:hypothetical protein